VRVRLWEYTVGSVNLQQCGKIENILLCTPDILLRNPHILLLTPDILLPTPDILHSKKRCRNLSISYLDNCGAESNFVWGWNLPILATLVLRHPYPHSKIRFVTACLCSVHSITFCRHAAVYYRRSVANSRHLLLNPDLLLCTPHILLFSPDSLLCTPHILLFTPDILLCSSYSVVYSRHSVV
jgi:hypothetical protein